MLPSLLASALSASTIHPEPRKFHALGGSIHWGAAPLIDTKGDASPAALEILRDSAAKLPKPATPVRIIIGTRQNPQVAAFLKEVPEVSGAYRIQADTKRIVLAGHDARGTYYAALTFAGLIGKDGSLPAVDLSDWPEVPDRGVVEGFYGTPWPHEKRLRVIEFLGEHKMDTYIYGPKDDPYHSTPKWREPYPAAEAEKIRELARASAKHHVDFYWAIHPGKDIRWNDEDYGKVLAKFEAMYGLGVRAFAVFFDDISGEGTKADRQADLLNRLHRDFVVKKGDVRPLVMCPTQYNKAWSRGDYLDTLGTRLDPTIQVMWTGDSVVHDMNRTGMDWINAKLRRKAYIWWNNPVTDYVRDHLLMGPVYGNDPDIGPLYGGFVSNPMERPEASRVALFGVADYTWNPEKYDPEASFVASMRAILPGAPEAFETFCRHNADLGKNTHGYRRKESVRFAPIAETFMTALREGKNPDATAVRKEFEAIAAAPAKIRAAGSDNPLLIGEISPWLDAFADLGRAGVSALDALDSLETDPGKSWSALAASHAALDAMAEIDRTQNRNPNRPGVKTASLVVTPMVKELVETLDSRLLAGLSGGTVARLLPVTSAKERETLSRMIDGDDQTFAYFQELQKAGDWFGLDFGTPKEVHRVRLLLGRDDKDHDRIHDGILEGDIDGSWQPLGKVDAVRFDLTLDPPRTLRALRVRIVKPGSPAKAELWTAIRAFDVNPAESATVLTDIPALAKLPVRLDGSTISLSPVLEIHQTPKGASLGLQFSAPAKLQSVTADLEITDPARVLTLETTRDGSRWEPLSAKPDGTQLTAAVDALVSAVRIRNSGNASLDIKLKTFRVTRADLTDSASTAATDGLLSTTLSAATGAKIPLPKGEGGNVVVLASPANGQSVIATAISSDGRTSKLGTLRNGFGRFPLPPDTTAISLSSTSPVIVNEIFRAAR